MRLAGFCDQPLPEFSCPKKGRLRPRSPARRLVRGGTRTPWGPRLLRVTDPTTVGSLALGNYRPGGRVRQPRGRGPTKIG